MNTPAHLAASVFIWRREAAWRAAGAVAGGALTPDLPMFFFYGYQKLIAGTPERVIWSTRYFEESWQLLFDAFNSIPIFLLLVAVCYVREKRLGVLYGASALVHLVFDLLLHNDDAHRHFLPLSHWRFMSPVSYWDPKHFGLIFVWIELAFALAACIYVCRRGAHVSMRTVALTTLVLYAGGIVFAVIMWVGL